MGRVNRHQPRGAAKTRLRMAGIHCWRVVHYFCYIAVVALVLTATRGVAQSNATDAAMDGYILDANGGAINNAQITARNMETNITTETASDSSGYYRFPILKIGKYEVVVKATGFSAFTKTGITLEVGAKVRVDAALNVGAVATSIEVVSDASVLETATPATGATLGSKTLRVLPITSRNIYNFAFFSPGVKGYPTTTFTAPNPAFDGIISAQQQLDGLDNTQRSSTNPIRLVITTPEVLEQNQVIVNGAPAEFGRTAGGIVNAITRSGTNEYHGQVLAAFRPNAWRAINALITSGKPSSKWLDYDGNVGGPIIRNRMFFFTNFEYNTLQNPSAIVITSADAATLGIPSSELGSVSSSERYPTPSVRVDYKLNDKNNMFARWSYFSNLQPNDWGGGYIPANTYLTWHDHMVSGEVQLATTPSPTLLNELRFGVTRREDSETNMLSSATTDVLTVIDNVAQIGYNPYAGDWVTDRIIQGVDNVTKTKGRHTVKMGVDFENSNIDFVNSMTRQYEFDSLQDYLNTLNGVSSSYAEATFQFGTPSNDNVWNFLSLFAQDEYRITRKLTMNIGLRYQHGFWPGLDPNAPYEYSRKIHTSTLDFAPRLSFSYQLTPNTVLRTAGGLYFDNPATLAKFNDVSVNNGHKLKTYVYTPTSTPAIVYPNIPTTAQLTTAQTPSISTYDPNYRDMYSLQANAQVEHSFTNDLSVNVQYQFLAMREGTYGHDVNLGTAVCTLADGRAAYTAKACGTGTSSSPVRPNSSFGQIIMISSGSTINYNGLDLTVKERLRHGVEFEATYSWSKTLGTNEQTNTIEDPTSLSREYGRMSSDMHHNFVLNGFFSPTMSNKKMAWINKATLSTMTYIHSGSPIDVYAGSDLNGDENRNDRPLFYMRNALTGPNLYEVDARLGYNLPLPGRFTLNVYSEAENLFNHPNRNCNATSGCTNATNRNITSSSFLQPTADRNPRGFNFGSKITF